MQQVSSIRDLLRFEGLDRNHAVLNYDDQIMAIREPARFPGIIVRSFQDLRFMLYISDFDLSDVLKDNVFNSEWLADQIGTFSLKRGKFTLCHVGANKFQIQRIKD